MAADKSLFLRGMKDGLAIGLGYLSVSFSFGILAISMGLSWWQAVLVSLLNLTSAGQVAAVGIMGGALVPGFSLSGGMIEMAVSTLIINLRYSLMGISLSQKTDETMTTPVRLITGYVITDEVFGVASSQESVSRDYMLGVGILPIIGWTSGTLLGALCGSILPEIVTSALTIGLYGMFVAIVLPVARKDKMVAIVSLISMVLSVIFYYVPFLKEHVSSGFAIIICAVASALVGVLKTPSGDREDSNG